MSRGGKTWFRMYNEMLDCPKVQLLPAEDFKHWINILCCVCRYGTKGILPPVEELAFNLRISTNDTITLLERLLERCLIDRRNGGTNGYRYACHDWEKMQYESDSSTERVQQHRNVSETPPETETETETETEEPKEVKPARQKTPRFSSPTLEQVREYCSGRDSPIDAERFLDFYESKGWMVGKNKMKDWKAAVRNWERSDERKNGSNGKTSKLDLPTGEVDYAAGW